MPDKPIIFLGAEVRSLWDGRKTMTRRLMPGQKYLADAYQPIVSGCCIYNYSGEELISRAPYAPGDRLWVREAFAIRRFEPCLDHERAWQSLSSPVVRYIADGTEIAHNGDRRTGRGIYHGPVELKKSPLAMPRWASRMTLIVDDVKVERLQDISEDDAQAEGIRRHRSWGGAESWRANGVDLKAFQTFSARSAFSGLWNSIHGPDAWDANPWCAATSFRVIKANIDSPEARA